MADRNSSFIVPALRPEVSGGVTKGVYQLTNSSVSPTRVTGMDDAGMPIEETYPAAYSKLFVGLDGCVKDVPMRTTADFSTEGEHERYEQTTTRDIIRDGQLPLEVCPYTGQFKYITGQPSLVKVPAGAEDCGGAPKGCKHMQAVIVERQKRARVKHDKLQEQAKVLKSDDVEKMLETTVKAFGVVMQQNNVDSAKARLRDGKSSE